MKYGFFNQDEGILFLVEPHYGGMLLLGYADETNERVAGYEYHFDADDDVGKAGWYEVTSTVERDFYEELDISEAISFEGIVIPQDTPDSVITMLNTYVGALFKFVDQ